MQYLNPARTVFTYQGRGGDVAFGRCEIRPLTPEIGGFCARSAERVIVEAVFVPCDHAELASWLIETGVEQVVITTVLDAHGIPYRYPSNTASAAVTSLPERDADRPTQRVA